MHPFNNVTSRVTETISWVFKDTSKQLSLLRRGRAHISGVWYIALCPVFLTNPTLASSRLTISSFLFWGINQNPNFMCVEITEKISSGYVPNGVAFHPPLLVLLWPSLRLNPILQEVQTRQKVTFDLYTTPTLQLIASIHRAWEQAILCVQLGQIFSRFSLVNI